MKKILIIAGLIFTTAVTAFALTRKESKPTVADKVTIENPSGKANTALATAD